MVFGEIAGKMAKKIIAENVHDRIVATEFDTAVKSCVERIATVTMVTNEQKISLSEIKKELQKINEKCLSVLRSEKLLSEAVVRLNQLYDDLKNVVIANKSLFWNEELVNYFEIENLLLNSLAATYSALSRKESRGAHYRNDYVNRDDENWLCHSVIAANEEVTQEWHYKIRAVNTSSEIAQLNLTPMRRKY